MTSIIDTLIQELNDEQKKAVLNPIRSCTKIVAGAGTGKTKIISKRFVKLVIDLAEQNVENPTSRILVITFTDKASNEMKERILKELTQANLNNFKDDLWISTIHSFCSKILRKHAIEAHLAPDFELADEETYTKIYESIIKTLKYNEYAKIQNIDKIAKELGLSSEILSIKNLKKLRHINDVDNILSDILNTIKKIKAFGLTPKEFLLKTIIATQEFTNCIAKIPFGFSDINSYIMGWENHLSKYKDPSCIFDGKKGAFENIAKAKNILLKDGRKPANTWSAAENFIENLNQETETELYLTKVIALIYAIYQQELENKNLATFDDLINKTLFILKNNPILKTYYQKFFKHIIVDEFQDTSGAQLELIKTLLDETAPNITFVGDRKQSIYGFRYAQMENLEVLHKYIETNYHQKYPEIKLMTNYRSTPQVLNAVNYITTEYLKLDEQLSPNPNKQFEEENKLVKNTEIINADQADANRLATAKYIAYEINRLKTEDKNIQYKDFAIIIETHNHASILEKILTNSGIPSIKKTSQDFFNNPTIKTAISAIKLFKNPLDEIALIKLLSVSLNASELYALKKEIDEQITKNNITLTKTYPTLNEKIISLYEKNLLTSKPLKQIYDYLSSFIKKQQSKSILQAFTGIEKQIPLYIATNSIEQFQQEYKLRIFEKIISDYEDKKSYVNFSDFLEYYDKIEKDKYFDLPNISTKNINAVQIITTHASKGLEFDYTFLFQFSKPREQSNGHIIFDLQYGNKPGFGIIITGTDTNTTPKNTLYKELWSKPRYINEKLRLFYVATSRAKKYLNILTGEKQYAEYTKNYPKNIIKETIDANTITTVQCNDTIVQENNITSKPIIAKKITQPEKSYNYKFSFSKLNCYLNCNKKFLLKYKYGFDTVSKTNNSIQIGSIVHKLIYNSFLFKKYFNKSEILNFLQNQEIKQDELTKILNLYNTYTNSQYSVTSLKNQTIFYEKPFNFTLTSNNKKIEFVGDIDLLIKNSDKTYTIVDFKTNDNLEKSNPEYQKQLYLYKKALEEENLIIKSAKLVGLTQDGTVKEIELDETKKLKEDFEANLTDAINCYEGILKPTQNTSYCDYCEYGYICNK